MSGWIKLHRGLLTHWIFADAKKFKWWITILMKVNFEPNKLIIGNVLVEVGKGESVRSLRSWGMEFNTTPKTVKTFFDLLESDGMIKTKSIGISTHLTVCNWESYQDLVNTKETQSKQLLPTIKKEKKEKNNTIIIEQNEISNIDKRKEQIKIISGAKIDEVLKAFEKWADYMAKQHNLILKENEYTYDILLVALKNIKPENFKAAVDHSIVSNYKKIYEPAANKPGAGQTVNKKTTKNINKLWDK